MIFKRLPLYHCLCYKLWHFLKLNLKSKVVVWNEPAFYITMMKPKILQACSLIHSIKKGMFSLLSKLNLFKLGRRWGGGGGGVLLLFPTIPLATRLYCLVKRVMSYLGNIQSFFEPTNF